jgi:hypothetical protein
MALEIKIYKAIILPFVLYGHETCSLTLREEHNTLFKQNHYMEKVNRLDMYYSLENKEIHSKF